MDAHTHTKAAANFPFHLDPLRSRQNGLHSKSGQANALHSDTCILILGLYWLLLSLGLWVGEWEAQSELASSSWESFITKACCIIKESELRPLRQGTCTQ